MTHRDPSDQNEAVRQWSRQTDPVERAMTRRPSMLTRSPSMDEGRLLPSDRWILTGCAAFNKLGMGCVLRRCRARAASVYPIDISTHPPIIGYTFDISQEAHHGTRCHL